MGTILILILTFIGIAWGVYYICDAPDRRALKALDPKAQGLSVRGYSRITYAGRPPGGTGTFPAIHIDQQAMKQMQGKEPWAVWDQELEDMYQAFLKESGSGSGCRSGGR